MNFEARSGQEQVLAADDPVLVVLGGAGTGKTTVAAAVVRKILDHQQESGAQPRRALFLSFSRAAVSQIVDRTNGTLGPHANLVEVTTFHAFAWSLIRRWGHTVGLPDPTLISPSEAKLLGASEGITYGDLLPLALKLLDIRAVREHLERRWAVIVSDEFQDTSHEQFALIQRLRGKARLVLLGDLNQCIYTNLPGVVGVGPARVAAALKLPGARQIRLPDVSHRDPTNILPAAASAIRQRDFNHVAVAAALDSGRLEVRHHHDPAAEGALVSALTAELRDAGHESVGIFSHHVDATASLSDHLNSVGIAHEIVGLPDSVASALETQFEMLCFAAGGGSIEAIRRGLGIFVTSTERGGTAPQLARMIVGQIASSATLSTRLTQLESSLLSATSCSAVLELCSQVPDSLGLKRGGRAWDRGSAILSALLGPRLCRATSFPPGGFDYLRERLADRQVSLLTYSAADDPSNVQLMGLYQSKGREADATIVVLRGNDYFGTEAEPMPAGSKLLYVVLTRARQRTVVLTLGSPLPRLIYPLAVLSAKG
ncbi:ATP-dependent helicase [Tsukamurella tyrosinosolvens]|uniref:UvrD-helicase domain-containing protein n=1 Tax=Tsukamurella TaxID=2060 RepID=UPI001401E23F|nr:MULTISPECIES: UvrD-helicase domain-containing protein [Tsukamurella]MCA4997899.1 ATP-dependent helicase [Tsukamurella tyrosinosolvens]